MARWSVRTKNLRDGNVAIYVRRREGQREVESKPFPGTLEQARAWCDKENSDEKLRTFAGDTGTSPIVTPRLRDVVPDYLKRATKLAPTTLQDQRGHLSDEGPILPFLGDRRLDEIDQREIHAWWDQVMIDAGKARQTGLNWLSSLSAVYRYARARQLVDENPIGAFRESLRDEERTKQARAEASGDKANPVRDPQGLERLLEAAREEGPDNYVFVLLMADAGLRFGEATALRWGDVYWAEGAHDRNRHLVVSGSCSRGGARGTTKSGRTRTVHLSARLWRVLRELFDARPALANVFILPRELAHNGNFGRRPTGKRSGGPWPRILKRAGFAVDGPNKHRPKDLRATFASVLETAGIPLAEIQRQMGHSDPGVTRGHYARWLAGMTYLEPVEIGPAEVPADVIARATDWWPVASGAKSGEEVGNAAQ